MVIIPVYNCERYLNEAVQSVINQPYPDINIILIDDGSTDDSPEICDMLADKSDRISVIHKENGGVSSARNMGVEYVLTNYENLVETYIAFLDADDVWTPFFFDEDVIKVVQDRHDLIGFQSCVCNHLMTRRREAEELKEGAYTGGTHSVWIHSAHHFAAMLYSAEFLRRYNLRFYPISASEDKIFSMQSLYLADSIYIQCKLMYLYRANETSAVHMRKRGMDYFPPIIDAYLISDAEMLKWKNGQRGELAEGKKMAQLYINDMIKDHFEAGENKRQMDVFLQKRTDYLKFLSLNEYEATYTQHKRLMYRIHGMINMILRKIYYFKIVKNRADLIRYTIKM